VRKEGSVMTKGKEASMEATVGAIVFVSTNFVVMPKKALAGREEALAGQKKEGKGRKHHEEGREHCEEGRKHP